MSRRVHVRLIVVIATVVGLLVSGLPAVPGGAQSRALVRLTASPSGAIASVGSAIPRAQRHVLLGAAAAGNDTAITVVGDAEGVTVLKGVSGSGYSWTPIATLSAAGVETDRWVANWCVASDGSKVVVVYGARAMVNDESLMDAGGWASIVDTASGAVTSLGRGYTMAYFDPTCGPNGTVALTAFDADHTLLGLLDASRGTTLSHISVAGEVTSAAPDAKGNIVAVAGDAIRRYAPDGASVTVVATTGIAHSLSVDAQDRLTYLASSVAKSVVDQLDLATPGAQPSTIATGPLTGTGIARDAHGKLYLLGRSLEARDRSIPIIDAATTTKMSNGGSLAIEDATADIPEGGATSDTPRVSIDAVTTATGRSVRFTFTGKHARRLSLSTTPSVGRDGRIRDTAGPTTAAALAITGSSTSPIEAERVCSIPRNDPANQVMQPKPRQVEWAVDMAVGGHLTTTSAENLTNLGSASFSPQGMFPLPALVGGGHIPSQLVLGVLAQESNLWQADRYTSPGAFGNPLIGNYYGNGAGDTAFWTIDFPGADCGYGVGQITDGMRMPGLQQSGAPVALPAAQQRAIAIDYSTNIARTVQMLANYWNQEANAGMVVNGGSSSGLESWFTTVWAYNTGFHAKVTGAPWGVGWANNPVNPVYNPSRTAFLQATPADASHPQDWPYPEKVMGFAAWGLQLPESVTVAAGAHPTGYTTTLVYAFNLEWWDNDADRQAVKPPLTTFCTIAADDCDPSTQNKCTRDVDHECWWHSAVSWKACPVQCGHENVRFPYPTYAAAQPDGTSLPGHCDLAGLPSGSLIVDDVPSATKPARSGCTKQTTTGSFAFTFFSPDSHGSYPAKIDLHQQGGGFNDHFYFSHVRDVSPGRSEEISGTWSLGQSSTAWTRVFVHVPSYAAWSPQAGYTINFGNGSSETRTVNQRRFANEWVELGVFHMAGVPSITLTNIASYGQGFDDIAWDAVAFKSLAAKPANFVVALGDSFSSGEGATTNLTTGADYTSESDHDGTSTGPNSLRDACHRSGLAWSRKATLPDSATSIGSRADTWDPTLDYHLLACSGATADNVETGGVQRFGEPSQLDQGYLDSNTTLVTISIGGNDLMFAQIVQQCVEASAADLIEQYRPCNEYYLPGDSIDLKDATAARLANAIPADLATVLADIHQKAPNARIILMGYPELFQTDSTCVDINAAEDAWLNSVSASLKATTINAATAAAAGGIPVKFADPDPFFSGHNLCTSTPAENGLVVTQTPGDAPMWTIPMPGPNFGVGVSQQSIHPNPLGTTYYAQTLKAALNGFYP